MKTNILFASLILMLSSYDACAAASQPGGSIWCCCPRTRAPQPQHDITHQIPVAALAPAPQAATAAATTDPQTPAPTAAQIERLNATTGAATVDSWVGEGSSELLPPAALTGIGSLSLIFGQQKNAAAASISKGTEMLFNQGTQRVGKFFENTVPVVGTVAGRLFNIFAPKAQASAQLIADQTAESMGSFAESLANTFVSWLPRKKTPLEKLRDTACTVPVCGVSLAVLVATFAVWYVNSQPTPVQI